MSKQKDIIMFNKPFLYLFLVFSIVQAYAQQEKVIQLKNPSFEDAPRISITPTDWYDCGLPNESPVDIHPVPNGGDFRVTQKAAHGKTYVGMVVRDNGTSEAIAQKLAYPLLKDSMYLFSVELARSPTYESMSRAMGTTVNYNRPAVFKIWVGNEVCANEALLGETPPIDHAQWKEYRFLLQPKEKDFSYIRLEAYYNPKLVLVYNGNILLDNLSPITSISKSMFANLDTSGVYLNTPKSNIRAQPIPDEIREIYIDIAFDDNTSLEEIAEAIKREIEKKRLTAYRFIKINHFVPDKASLKMQKKMLKDALMLLSINPENYRIKSKVKKY